VSHAKTGHGAKHQANDPGNGNGPKYYQQQTVAGLFGIFFIDSILAKMAGES
jgi:hypothetical protein